MDKKLDRKLKLMAALHQSMEVVKQSLELRTNAQLTQGILDRHVCDAMIGHSAAFIKEIITELNTKE